MKRYDSHGFAGVLLIFTFRAGRTSRAVTEDSTSTGATNPSWFSFRFGVGVGSYECSEEESEESDEEV